LIPKYTLEYLIINLINLESKIFSLPESFEQQFKRPKGFPSSLRGRWFLNGPAGFSSPIYKHWLDGDGMLRMLSFGDEIIYKGIYIDTQKRIDEKDIKKPLYRTFGTSFKSDQLRKNIALRTPANVSVFSYADRLLCFGEQSLPLEVDTFTGRTKGEWLFHNKLNPLSQISAHPKIIDNEFVNFGVRYLKNKATIDISGFDIDWNKILRKRVDLDYPYYIHDFSLTSNYIIFYLSPYFFNISSFIQKKKSVSESLEWKNSLNSVLLIVEKNDLEMIHFIDLGNPNFVLHHINSYESDLLLQVDVLENMVPYYNKYDKNEGILNNMGNTSVVRYTVDIEDWKLLDKKINSYSNLHLDFPHISSVKRGKEYKEFWSLGLDIKSKQQNYYNQLLKFDWNNFDFISVFKSPRNKILSSEPCLIYDKYYEHNFLILQEYDLMNDKSSLIIFDSNNIESGPKFSFQLNSFDPLGFHTFFNP
tara:strand:+ start:2771 stop:4195 length:1425 start_codon:yes stop_codon:yes gene_type:complete